VASTPLAYAFMFPGQGNQYPGMGWHACQRSRRARELFAEAESLTGMSIRRLCFEGSRAELARTQITQPCQLVANVADVAALEEELEASGRRLRPRFVAGHSLGHYAALVTASALSFATALELVRARAGLMGAVTDGGMATVVGLSEQQVQAACDLLTHPDVVVAAVNGPDHTVISGPSSSLVQLAHMLRDAGATRVVSLPISIPAHSPLMADAQAALAPHVTNARFTTPRFPVVLNSTACPTSSVADIRSDLASHMCTPVRWWPSVQGILASGVGLLIDTGPGRTLIKSLGPTVGEDMIADLERPGAVAALLR
jgi:[acyl-carrier-protein] S-malonyltransferase